MCPQPLAPRVLGMSSGSLLQRMTPPHDPSLERRDKSLDEQPPHCVYQEVVWCSGEVFEPMAWAKVLEWCAHLKEHVDSHDATVSPKPHWWQYRSSGQTEIVPQGCIGSFWRRLLNPRCMCICGVPRAVTCTCDLLLQTLAKKASNQPQSHTQAALIMNCISLSSTATKSSLTLVITCSSSTGSNTKYRALMYVALNTLHLSSYIAGSSLCERQRCSSTV